MISDEETEDWTFDSEPTDDGDPDDVGADAKSAPGLFAGLSSLFPVFGAAVLVEFTVSTWGAPLSALLLYFATVVPLSAGLRYLLAPGERTRAGWFALALVAGSLVSGAWALPSSREFVVQHTDLEVHAGAVVDPDEQVAAAACIAALDPSSSMRRVSEIVDRMSPSTARECARRTAPSVASKVSARAVRRFARQLRSTESPLCEGVDAIATMTPRDRELSSVLWRCVGGDHDEELRRCCAGAIEELGGAGSLGGVPSASWDEEFVSWLVTAAFRPDSQDRVERSVVEELELSSSEGRDAVLAVACRADVLGRLDAVDDLNAAVVETCGEISSESVLGLTATDWGRTCAATEGDAAMLCDGVRAHLVSSSMAATRALVSAARSAWGHGSDSGGIVSGHATELALDRDVLVRLERTEDRLESERIERPETIGAVRNLRSALRDEARRDALLRYRGEEQP